MPHGQFCRASDQSDQSDTSDSTRQVSQLFSLFRSIKKPGDCPAFFIDELLLYIKSIEPVSYPQFQIGGVARLNGDVFTVTGDFVADFSWRDLEADFDTGLAVAADNFLVDESLEQGRGSFFFRSIGDKFASGIRSCDDKIIPGEGSQTGAVAQLRFHISDKLQQFFTELLEV